MSLDLALKNTFLRESPADAAQSIERLSGSQLGDYVRGVDTDSLLPCLARLTVSRAQALFEQLDTRQKTAVLTRAPSWLALTLLGGLDAQARDALLSALPPSLGEDLVRQQSYEDDSAGSLLDRPYDTIRESMTVAEALEVLRRAGAKRTRSVYVVDANNKLAGRADMQSMAMAEPGQHMSEILEDLEGSVLATSPRSEVVEQLERYRVDSLPVVDVDGHLLGIVRYQRLFEAIESVATADLQKMVGASEDEDGHLRIWNATRSRRRDIDPS